jgi:hypothetical protein
MASLDDAFKLLLSNKEKQDIQPKRNNVLQSTYVQTCYKESVDIKNNLNTEKTMK